MGVFLFVWAIFMIFCIGGLIRTEKFGKFMRAEISRVSESRLADIRNGNSFKAQWPDVMACYKNLKWYDIFNYDFKSLMVYDRAK
jgi:hypothetical protein